VSSIELVLMLWLTGFEDAFVETQAKIVTFVHVETIEYLQLGCGREV
jgi:hypothetical protein